jgi:uncharacterized protein YigE (DUF2233 family)
MVLTACGRKRESSPAASAKNDLAAVDTIATPAGTYVVVAVDPARVEFKMQIRGSDGQPFRNLRAFRDQLSGAAGDFVAATNAGIYEDSLTTSGLHVADGVVQHPINLNSGGGNFYAKPNGVFYVDLKGAPHVVESAAAASLIPQMRVATQSGPLMVNRGEVNATILPWKGTALRNGIGVCRDGLVRVAMSTTLVTMSEFAKLFASSGCDDALYLDGQVSGLVLPDLSVVGIGAPVAAVLGIYGRSAER